MRTRGLQRQEALLTYCAVISCETSSAASLTFTPPPPTPKTPQTVDVGCEVALDWDRYTRENNCTCSDTLHQHVRTCGEENNTEHTMACRRVRGTFDRLPDSQMIAIRHMAQPRVPPQPQHLTVVHNGGDLYLLGNNLQDMEKHSLNLLPYYVYRCSDYVTTFLGSV
ncbi:hypothetical protein C0Q70_15708 [Pomacea canaliculata]|uniref:Uncharacterized protein n=1 Tax=Pomacea canaliculata TaxID=400727 RepID=A0A2T7NVL1_POMCA|nr:hypothetical protein C0Q70_15708 [Pomacea canaliculata]